jgi:hypothetical protein
MPVCFTLGLPIVTVTIGNNYRICCVTASGGRAISASSPCALFVCQVQPLSKYSGGPITDGADQVDIEMPCAICESAIPTVR